MSAYSKDISQVMAWTVPQLRLLARYRGIREREVRRWQLVLAGGTMSQEAVETLWEQLTDDDTDGEYAGVAAGGGASNVDSHGNVRAAGAPLLSDIALGKATLPQGMQSRTTVIDKNKLKEENA